MKNTVMLLWAMLLFYSSLAQKQQENLNYKIDEILIQVNEDFKVLQIEKQFAAFELSVVEKISKSLKCLETII